MAVSKDMTIMQIIERDESIAPILMNAGMHCLGCAMAHGETIEEACMVHGIDCDDLIDAINEHLGE